MRKREFTVIFTAWGKKNFMPVEAFTEAEALQMMKDSLNHYGHTEVEWHGVTSTGSVGTTW